ncbi:MAG TPA: hypothetical protein VIA18_29655, partial [Polyangia bacterium]|nr:hypothetical protein [Polyangia bacterium]
MTDSGKEHTGELDFSDGELAEMGVEVVGRDAAPQPRRSRSMLRIPVDEVPRPQPEAARVSGSTEPSMPAFSHEGDAADEVVDHAFSNGGEAEGVVPAALRLLAAPLKDELEAFSAQLFAERDRVLEHHRAAAEVEEVEAEPDDDTDPKALQTLRAEEAARARVPTPIATPAMTAPPVAAAAPSSQTPDEHAGAIPQPVDDAPTRELAMSIPFGNATPPTGISTRPMSPALAALARAVAAPSDRKGDWLSPAQATAEPADPASVDARVAAVAAAFIEPEIDDGDDEMELDGAELEDVEQLTPPPKPRARTLTPVTPVSADDVEGVTAALLAVTTAAAGAAAPLPSMTPTRVPSLTPPPPIARAAPAVASAPRTTPPAGQPAQPSTPAGNGNGAATNGATPHAATTTPTQAPAAASATPPAAHATPTPGAHAPPPPTPSAAMHAAPPATAGPTNVAAPPPVPAAPPPMPAASAQTHPQAHPPAPAHTPAQSHPPAVPAPAAVAPTAAATAPAATQSDAPLRPRRKRRAKQWF